MVLGRGGSYGGGGRIIIAAGLAWRQHASLIVLRDVHQLYEVELVSSWWYMCADCVGLAWRWGRGSRAHLHAFRTRPGRSDSVITKCAGKFRVELHL